MLKFRPATLADTDAIVKLVNSAYRGDSSKVGWTTEADILGGQRTDANHVSEMILDSQARIELAFSNEELVGCVYLRHEDEITTYFGMLVVRPTLQTQGLGKQLMQQIESVARAWNTQQIRMSVIHTREELIAFYQRRGYQATGKWEPFPENDPDFGLPKVTGLRFLEFIKPLV